MTFCSLISCMASLSSNNRTSYDRHPLLWSAGMMARALIVRIYSLRLVWRRGGRWRALADCWQSERRDRPMSGRACYHGVTQQLLCCGQGLWSASGSGTVLCMGAKKTDPLLVTFFIQKAAPVRKSGGEAGSRRLVATSAFTKTDGSEKSFSGARPTIVPTLTPGAMAWPKWHSAEPSHRVRIAHHRARHERAHLPSPLQPHGSSATALRLHGT